MIALAIVKEYSDLWTVYGVQGAFKMVSPIQPPKSVKLDTEIELEFQNSCNCLCCPIIRSRSPAKSDLKPDNAGSDGVRKYMRWPSLKKIKKEIDTTQPTPANSPVDKTTHIANEILESKQDS